MTLSELRTRILEKVGRAGDSTLNDAVRYALETVQDEVTRDIGFPELSELDVTSLKLVANQQDYDLPDDFGKPIIFWNNTRFEYELKRLDAIEYSSYWGDVNSQTGTDPIYYDIIGSESVSSTYRKKIKFLPFPASILNGAITTFADYSGTVAGTVLITDTAHGLVTGDSITIAGTTNYNATYTVTKVDADTFYITATYVAEAGGATKVWTLNKYIPFAYNKNIAYLSADTDENALTYMYPQLFIEGACYYLFRDKLYIDAPEKIAFRRTEFNKVIDSVKGEVSKSDKIHGVLPKRYTSLIRNQFIKLYRTQYTGYAS